MASEPENVPNESGGKPQEGGEGSEDLTQFVEKLLGDMHQKFQQMSDQIIGRLDEMGKRVEDLEKNINELMQQVESREESGAKK